MAWGRAVLAAWVVLSGSSVAVAQAGERARSTVARSAASSSTPHPSSGRAAAELPLDYEHLRVLDLRSLDRAELTGLEERLVADRARLLATVPSPLPTLAVFIPGWVTIIAGGITTMMAVEAPQSWLTAGVTVMCIGGAIVLAGLVWFIERMVSRAGNTAWAQAHDRTDSLSLVRQCLAGHCSAGSGPSARYDPTGVVLRF